MVVVVVVHTTTKRHRQPKEVITIAVATVMQDV